MALPGFRRPLRWAWILVLVPTVTEQLESGGPPSWGRDVITDVVMTIVVAALVAFAARQADELTERAELDPLTALFNRRRFDEDLRREVARAERMRTGLVLAFVDVDHFKAVNDTHGHEVGDRVLRLVAGALRRAVRQDVDRCYRVGGDEFAIVLPGSGELHIAALLDRAHAAVAATSMEIPSPSISIGAVEWRPGESVIALRQRSDARMYEAKKAGRGRTVIEPGLASST